MPPKNHVESPRVSIDPSGAIILRIERVTPPQTPDELVAFPFGLERAAATAVIRKAQLPAAKIGRRYYARRSDVLALVEKLARPAMEDDADPYRALVEAERRKGRR